MVSVMVRIMYVMILMQYLHLWMTHDSITFDPLSWLAYDVHVLNDQTLEHVHHGPIVAPVEPQIQFPVEPQPNLVNVPLENHVHVEPRVESQVILQP